MRRSASELRRACASVLATTNSTPFRPRSIMLLTALPPAPPTPNTVMRGLSSVRSGTLRLIVMAASNSCELSLAWLKAHPACAPSSSCPLKILHDPLANFGEVACPRTQEPLLGAGTEFFVAARPMQEKTDRGGEIRRGGRWRQTIHGARAAKPRRASKHVRGKLRQAGELAAAAGQHQVLGDFGGKAAGRQPAAHK